MKIRKNDQVMVITGEDRGKKGQVREAFPDKNRVIVKGVRVAKRHTKPRGTTKQAGIIDKEMPMSVSDVLLICPKCQKPTRVGVRILEDKNRVRLCKKCQEVID